MHNHLFKLKFIVLIAFSSVFVQLIGQTPGFTSTEYKKALWMTTRMYGGQRSGSNNWLLHNHLPSGVNTSLRGTAFIGDKDPVDNYDLSGGWHDCGDHVKFGHTMFYSAYVLLKAYDEFPTGYDDYYTYDYKGYATSGDWTWEGNKHDPNGIPDIVDEVKHATDYFIKCARNSSTFYYQVGTGGGNADHATWVTATKMQTQPVNQGGQPRVVYKNPKDASMPSFCGATLALMAKIYKKYDPAYSAQCLTAAQNAYAYAKANPGVAGTGAGGFYDPNNNWKDDYATMCCELFWATGNQAYRTEALAFSISAANGQGTDIYFNYSFDYSNNGDIAIYNLVKLGKTNALTVFNTLVTNNYINSTLTDGQYNGGNTTWGTLRYNGNSAFIVALWQKLNNPTGNIHKFILDNIDYILGKNASSQSFIVGFGTKSPKFPHHRNVYLRDDNPGDAAKRQMVIPAKNQQAGMLVGGTRSPGQFSDDVVNYQHTEPGIDYNAGLVGALGYINSRLAPVDTNKFGKNYPTPTLGPDQSLCGLTNILLKANVPTDGKKTFTWLNGATTVVNASTTQNTYTVTAAGTYTCRIDSASKWQTEDQIVISATLPTPNLGAAKVICDTTNYTLKSNVPVASNYAFEWQYAANGQVASLVKDANQTGTTWTNVRKAGLYRVLIKATGCTSTQSDVSVTSSLPTPQDGCAASAGANQTLAIVNPGLGTGTYDWYDAATAGTKVGTGTSITVNPTSTKTYYVQDASAVSGSVGPKTALAGAQNWGVSATNQMKFTISSSITISSIKILADYYASSGTITVEILDANGNAFSPAKTFVSNTLTFTSNATAGLVTVPFSGFTIDKTWGTNLRMRISSKSSGLNLNPYWNNTGAVYPYNSTPSGVFTITGTSGGDNDANDYMYFYDIQFNSGAVCARLPVIANVSANCSVTISVEDALELNNLEVYPNPSEGVITINLKEEVEQLEIINTTGKVLQKLYNYSNGNIDISNEPNGMYFVKVLKDGKSKSFKVIKQ